MPLFDSSSLRHLAIANRGASYEEIVPLSRCNRLSGNFVEERFFGRDNALNRLGLRCPDEVQSGFKQMHSWRESLLSLLSDAEGREDVAEDVLYRGRSRYLVDGPQGTMRGTVETELLTEVSGLVASRSQEDTLWAHNDSGDVARVFAMAVDGRHLGSYTLAGVEAIDWEDMAIGPGPVEGEDYLYLGDIGDNPAERPEIIIYRVLEPDAGVSGTLTDIETLVLRYPDRPHDAEVLLVDRFDGAIH